jgi:hypothetical protein
MPQLQVSEGRMREKEKKKKRRDLEPAGLGDVRSLKH